MNIDQKLEVIRKALEKGAQVKLHFHQNPTKQEAEEIMEVMGSASGIPVEHYASENGTRWYEACDFNQGMWIVAFYNYQHMEDDIFQEELS